MKTILPATILTIALTILAAFMMPGAAFAAATSSVSEACDFSGQIAALAAVQKDRSLSDAQELRAELGIRRQILSDAVTCDTGNIDARMAELQQLPDDIKSLPAYGQITESLAAAWRYYDNQKKNIPDLGLQGTKDVSRAIAGWREGNYLPLMAWTDGLVLWAGNQQFFERVSARLTQVSRLAFSLKLVDQDQVMTGFREAEGDFQKASEENDAARDALNQGQANSARAYIKASLKGLSDTYQIFFGLQETLQKIIK